MKHLLNGTMNANPFPKTGPADLSKIIYKETRNDNDAKKKNKEKKEFRGCREPRVFVATK